MPWETSRASGRGKPMMFVLFDKFTTTASVFLANFRVVADLLTSDRDFCLVQHSVKRNQSGLGKRSIF